ncbi:tRNA dimethylallyltransferase [subsurface metagenome]
MQLQLVQLNKKYNLIVVLGPTATGKTQFASNLAYRVQGEIISADSRQIYRKMNLGTGKDYEDYQVAGTQVPYHLIDIHDPGYKYNVFEYQMDFLKAFATITKQEKFPILCGGTGLYIEAVTKGYKLIAVPVNKNLRRKLENKSLPELEQILAGYKKLHNKTDTDTIKRAIRAIEIEEYYTSNPELTLDYPEINPVFLGIKIDRETRRERITKRMYNRLKGGMIEEVKSLIDEGLKPETLIYYGLEYKFITLYLTGKLNYDRMVEKLNVAIHQYAKRQMTWFRKMEREGVQIHWIDGLWTMEEKVKKTISLIKSK